jgi:hypothetical protein
VAEIVDFKPPGITCGTVDTTNQGCKTNGYRTKMPTDLKEITDCTYTCHVKSNQTVPVGTQQTDIVVTWPDTNTSVATSRVPLLKTG